MAVEHYLSSENNASDKNKAIAMRHKYQLLKTSWGIVIFLEIDEILNSIINDTDIAVTDKIYLRISDTCRLDKETIADWIGDGIKALAEEISKKIGNVTVCFDVKGIGFNYIDFQEEGLYCAVQEWISKYYEIPLPPVDVRYDRETNKYIFNFPHKGSR
jgi:hypothetical protein